MSIFQNLLKYPFNDNMVVVKRALRELHIPYASNDNISGQGNPVRVLNNKLQWYDTIQKKWTDVVTTGVAGDMFLNILYSDLIDLKSSNSLTLGLTYVVTDRNILVKAVSESILNPFCTRWMYTPKWPIVMNDDGLSWKGGYDIGNFVFNTYNIGDLVVWGAKVWRNLTGQKGSSLNQSKLDLDNWVVIPPSPDETYYKTQIFECIYDFENDWVEWQRDQYQNEMGIPYSKFQELNLNYYLDGENPIDLGDWFYNNISGTVMFKNNKCIASFNNPNVYGNLIQFYNNVVNGLIFNNYFFGQICENVVFNNAIDEGVYSSISMNYIDGSILRNVCSGINNNTFVQNVTDNKISGLINQNSFVGEICYNYCDSITLNSYCNSISYNRIPLSIEGNTNCLQIAYNSNLGKIQNCQVSILTYNHNNGDITVFTGASLPEATTSCSLNSNNGVISVGGFVLAITNNTNNGDISLINNDQISISYNNNNGPINTPSVTDITEPYVSK